jgi:hypothetical protein
MSSSRNSCLSNSNSARPGQHSRARWVGCAGETEVAAAKVGRLAAGNAALIDKRHRRDNSSHRGGGNDAAFALLLVSMVGDGLCWYKACLSVVENYANEG